MILKGVVTNHPLEFTPVSATLFRLTAPYGVDPMPEPYTLNRLFEGLTLEAK